MELSAAAQRVLGCLVEKQRTVPTTYPMTLNGLVGACNQTSNRWPIVHYDAHDVQQALDELKGAGLVRFVHAAHGERTTKFRQVLDERLGLEPDEMAVVGVLLLRGPQTAGELRSRTERLHPFGSLAEVEAVLRRLAEREEPLLVTLPRAPGHKEARVAHLLGGPVDVEAAPPGPPAAPARPAPPAVDAGRGGAMADLEARVARLERKVTALYALLGEQEDEVDGGAPDPSGA